MPTNKREIIEQITVQVEIQDFYHTPNIHNLYLHLVLEKSVEILEVNWLRNEELGPQEPHLYD